MFITVELAYELYAFFKLTYTRVLLKVRMFGCIKTLGYTLF